MATKRGSRFPAFLISTIVHTLLLILLALVARPAGTSLGSFLTARQSESTQVVTLEQVDLESKPLDAQQDDASTHTVAIEVTEQMVEAQALKPSQTLHDTIAVLDAQAIAGAIASASGGNGSSPSLKQIAKGGGLSGRSPQRRAELGEKYGATPESEEAVERALQYLAAHQRHDGSWSFNLKLDPCDGKCRHSKISSDDPTPPTAATGLALLAFLGAGHTHGNSSPYSDNIRKGLYYLRAVATETQMGLDWQKGSMYGHGIALMAIAEAITMTAGEEIRAHEFYPLAAGGVAFTCGAQHLNGSWGYYPKSPGDLTLTGWQVQSLIAARRNKLHPRTYTLPNAKEFALSTCGDQAYWFGYQGPPGEPTTTAVGLALMIYLGESPKTNTVMMAALDELAARGPMKTNVYHDYYAALALHHSRHRDWQSWNKKLRDHLVTTQEKSGHEKGSWHFKDRWGDVGGRLYTTAMCALTLEVYYRYEPLYGELGEFQLD